MYLIIQNQENKYYYNKFNYLWNVIHIINKSGSVAKWVYILSTPHAAIKLRKENKPFIRTNFFIYEMNMELTTQFRVYEGWIRQIHIINNSVY